MNAKHHSDGSGHAKTPRKASDGQESYTKKTGRGLTQMESSQPLSADEPHKLLQDENLQRRVVFQLDAAEARNVSLAADFTGWEKKPIPMSKGGSGVWRATVALKQGRHRYKFLVDGEWFDDPNCGTRIPNAFGTTDAVIEIS